MEQKQTAKQTVVNTVEKAVVNEYAVTLQKGISKKTKKSFLQLAIKLTPNYVKKAFLTEAETALLSELNKTELKAVLQTGIGKDSEKPYLYLDVKLTEDCTKMVMLEFAELSLLKMLAK